MVVQNMMAVAGRSGQRNEAWATSIETFEISCHKKKSWRVKKKKNFKKINKNIGLTIVCLRHRHDAQFEMWNCGTVGLEKRVR